MAPSVLVVRKGDLLSTPLTFCEGWKRRKKMERKERKRKDRKKKKNKK